MFNRTALAIALFTIGTSASWACPQDSSCPTGYQMAQAQLQDAAKGQCYQGCQDVYNKCQPKVSGGICIQNLNKCTAACDAPPRR